MAKRILIVDDDKEALGFLANGLIREGYEVLKAFDGLEAQSKISEDQPDVIVLDLVMPRLDGWGVLEWLKKEQLIIPTIILSAKDDIEYMKKGILGADTYLVKPVSVEDVLLAIRTLSVLKIGKDS